MFVFPIQLFNPRVIRAEIRGQSVPGGVSISGEEDFIQTDGGGRWDITYGGITLNTPEKLRAWNAWVAYLRSGARDVLAPLGTIARAPRATLGKAPQPVPEFVTSDPVFSEDYGYASPVVEVTLDANAVLRSTQLALTVEKGGELKGGEHFSIGRRAYKIIRPLGEGLYSIRPPLRESVFMEYDEVDFDWPVVRARLDPAEEPPDVEDGRSAEVSIRFVEIPPSALGDYFDEDEDDTNQTPEGPSELIQFRLEFLGGNGDSRTGFPGLGFWVKPTGYSTFGVVTENVCNAYVIVEHELADLADPDAWNEEQRMDVRLQIGTGTGDCPASGDKTENYRLFAKKDAWPDWRQCPVNEGVDGPGNGIDQGAGVLKLEPSWAGIFPANLYWYMYPTYDNPGWLD